MSLSFFVQIFTAEFVINMLGNSETRGLAQFVYDWIFLQGGITHSTYIIVNSLLGAWIIIHSGALAKTRHVGFYYFGLIVGIIHILSVSLFMLQLIVSNELSSVLSELATFLFIVWFIIYGMTLDRKMKVRI